MNKLDKMKKMVDGILGDDDLCEGCAECKRKYADEIIKILRMPEVAKMVDKADTSQTETHDLRTEAHECVKQTDCPWK